ncbi:hypothetical protein TNCV_2687521 [Trichonephila clavipes]|nr:hypothetical protein TNCV_2687521 [Trichonephila clavipes]
MADPYATSILLIKCIVSFLYVYRVERGKFHFLSCYSDVRRQGRGGRGGVGYLCFCPTQSQTCDRGSLWREAAYFSNRRSGFTVQHAFCRHFDIPP